MALTNLPERSQDNRPFLQAGPDELTDLLERIANEFHDHVRPKDRDLDQTIQHLAIRSWDTQQVTDPSFRKEAAYALERFEKLAGPTEAPDGLRQELSTFALERRLDNILTKAETIADPSLLPGIRARVEEIAEQLKENVPDARIRTDALEIQIDRLAPSAQERPEARNANGLALSDTQAAGTGQSAGDEALNSLDAKLAARGTAPTEAQADAPSSGSDRPAIDESPAATREATAGAAAPQPEPSSSNHAEETAANGEALSPLDAKLAALGHDPDAEATRSPSAGGTEAPDAASRTDAPASSAEHKDNNPSDAARDPVAAEIPSPPRQTHQLHTTRPGRHRKRRRGPPKQICRDVVQKLESKLPDIDAKDADLGDAVRNYVEQAKTKTVFDDDFVRKLAYAIQDARRLRINIEVSEPLQEEFYQRETSIDGLNDKTLSQFLLDTPKIKNQAIVESIRAAADYAATNPNNLTYASESVKLIKAQIQSAETEQTATNQPTSTLPTTTRVAETNNASSAAQSQPDQSKNQQQETNKNWVDGPVAYQKTVEGQVAAALHSQQPRPSMSDVPPSDIFRKLDTYKARKDIEAAVSAGQEALDATHAFTKGPGAAILARIDDAAKADPGGLSAVHAGMKAGGSYAVLRKDFNDALTTQKDFAESYDRAGAAVAKYSALRETSAPSLATHPDPTGATKKFDELDTKLVENAALSQAKTMGRTPLRNGRAKPPQPSQKSSTKSEQPSTAIHHPAPVLRRAPDPASPGARKKSSSRLIIQRARHAKPPLHLSGFEPSDSPHFRLWPRTRRTRRRPALALISAGPHSTQAAIGPRP